ncbi:MAG: biotin carboxylase N-terminal domain-containing protein [Lacisediminihabitans sp.]
MFEKVLIANRGEIACRVILTLRDMGIHSVAVYSDADRGAKHVAMADEAVRIGPPPAHDSYLNADAIIAAAQASGAQAIHPGYGFLSENADFAEKCEAAGIVFIGPGVAALGLMGDKIRAKQHVSKAGVPVIEGVSSPGLSNEQLEAAAIELGFPILVKPSAGGGGKGMVPVLTASELAEALATARRIAASAFGDDTLLLERLVTAPRHIEVQLLADTHGNVIHLGERECSLQRRHQKVIEEAPSPILSAETRARIGEAACTVARSVDYVGAGTVEFLVSDDAPDEFFFMEMNTRLQVEHPVTELVTGIDLVAWQLRVAAGLELTIAQDDVVLAGHAIEARVYAEDPESGFLPSTGMVVSLAEAAGDGVRVDSSLVDGLVVSPHYDPMLAKVIAWGSDRAQALERLDGALAETTVLGVRTNLEYLRALLNDADVRSGALDTTLIERRLPGLAFRHPDDELLAIAALYLQSRPTGTGVWNGHSGWRMGGTPRASRYRFALSSTERADVFVSGDAVTIDGRTHSVIWSEASNTIAMVEFDGTSSRWTIARDGETIWLGQRGFSWPLGIVSRGAETAEMVAGIEMAEKPKRPEVRSPMPGTVVTVSVADGAHVEAGDTILTVEAMKMEHKLTAPVAGTVSITATPGDLVKLDQLLASITVVNNAAVNNPEEKS